MTFCGVNGFGDCVPCISHTASSDSKLSVSLRPSIPILVSSIGFVLLLSFRRFSAFSVPYWAPKYVARRVCA